MTKVMCWIDALLVCPFSTDSIPDSKICHNCTQSQLSAALATVYRIGIMTNNVSMLKTLEKQIKKKNKIDITRI